ncbi:MAG: hypothetical protein ACT4OT_13850 [Acidobacteriota bacterium]
MNSERVRELDPGEDFRQPIQGCDMFLLVAQNNALGRATLGWKLVDAFAFFFASQK